ncbi:MAG: tagaturonate epimerase family protein [Planctomycetota bacterium]|jgi:hypothetical protein
MKTIVELLVGLKGSSSLTVDQQRSVAQVLSEVTQFEVYESSVSVADGQLLALARLGRERKVLLTDKEGRLVIMEADGKAAKVVREHFSWLRPRLYGLATSIGLGDRLGLATPGHLRAIAGSGCVPFVAQQSIREMTRTDRTAGQVMDEAMWGVFQEGWGEGFGSDADHLKTPADIDTCLEAGFTMYTFDPGDHVRSDVDSLDSAGLAEAMDTVAWEELEISLAEYLSKSFALDCGDVVSFDEQTLARAAIKYAGAVAHTVRMYRHLSEQSGLRTFEVEVSVDETATPTTVAEHYLVSAELKRLGVEWVSMAPRFIGSFEKGIDYKGDLSAFRDSFASHAAVARALGPYKLSLHSGSDKFSVYPIAADLASGLVHLKTAGTSYLEALRVVARKSPELFRNILDFAFSRFDEDRASYHISARIEAVPRSNELAGDRLETVLEGNDGRQLLHVTYGSVLTATKDDGGYLFRDEFFNVLMDHEEEHYEVLADHMGKHIRSFARG